MNLKIADMKTLVYMILLVGVLFLSGCDGKHKSQTVKVECLSVETPERASGHVANLAPEISVALPPAFFKRTLVPSKTKPTTESSWK